jgi:hypothetical protein
MELAHADAVALLNTAATSVENVEPADTAMAKAFNLLTHFQVASHLHASADVLGVVADVFGMFQAANTSFPDVQQALTGACTRLNCMFPSGERVSPSAVHITSFLKLVRASNFLSLHGQPLTCVPADPEAWVAKTCRAYSLAVQEALKERLCMSDLLTAFALFDPAVYARIMAEHGVTPTTLPTAPPEFHAALDALFEQHMPTIKKHFAEADAAAGAEIFAHQAPTPAPRITLERIEREFPAFCTAMCTIAPEAEKRKPAYDAWYVSHVKMVDGMAAGNTFWSPMSEAQQEAFWDEARKPATPPPHPLHYALHAVRKADQARRFPNLWLLFMMAVLAPMTTVMCERVFSIRTATKTERRTCMSLASLTACLHLSINGPRDLKSSEAVAIREGGLKKFCDDRSRRIFHRTSKLIENFTNDPKFARLV